LWYNKKTIQRRKTKDPQKGRTMAEECAICEKDVEKTVKCPLLNRSTCLSCCFAISSGRVDMIQRIRKEYELQKEEILKACSTCLEKAGGLG